jgi:hypothetical protein
MIRRQEAKPIIFSFQPVLSGNSIPQALTGKLRSVELK